MSLPQKDRWDVRPTSGELLALPLAMAGSKGDPSNPFMPVYSLPGLALTTQGPLWTELLIYSQLPSS